MQIEGKRRPIWPRVLGYFLAAMLLLTLVSRAADALLLPVVECARPLPGALSHIVTLRGVVEAEEQQPVAAEAGLTIARVCVCAGQAVEAGDVLAEYDREALQRILEEKQAALQALALQAQLEAAEPGTEPSSDGTVQPQSTSLDMQRQIAQQQLQDLETRAAQAEVARLTQLLYSGAALTAPVSGTISEVLVDVGDVATAGAAFRLAPASSALIARCEAASDQAEHLSIGMEARFQLSGEAVPSAEAATLRSLTPTPAGYEAVFALPDGSGALGQSVSITATQTTGTYEMCVPLDAIVYRGEATGVYRIRTRQSVLGEVEYAEFVAVTVQETDARSAAIDAALLAQDQVIVLSNKPVSEGDRVRSTA